MVSHVTCLMIDSSDIFIQLKTKKHFSALPPAGGASDYKLHERRAADSDRADPGPAHRQRTALQRIGAW